MLVDTGQGRVGLQRYAALSIIVRCQGKFSWRDETGEEVLGSLGRVVKGLKTWPR